jgi:hypothetical protein
MGCDIHLRVQKRVGDEWVFAEDQIPDKYEDGKKTNERWYDGRNYNLFGILANVRNGRGFAGCDTGDGFNPISEPRGLPDGMAEYIGEKKDEDGSIDGYEFWFGDHSHSWLTLSELQACDWYQQTKLRGWVNGVTFEEWDRLKCYDPAPKHWCGGISGQKIEHISAVEMKRRINEIKKAFPDFKSQSERIAARYADTYCLIEWPVFYSEAAGRFYTQTMPRMAKLAQEVGGPDNVRIVFGFDS